jgi:cytochrome c553
MRKNRLAHGKRMVGGLVLLALASCAGVLLVAWLGLYNVAASAGHWPIVDAFLRFGMENSVKARASDMPPPKLDDIDLIRLGAGHFHGGCAYCHGAPGSPISPVAESMLPPPPDLSNRIGHWRDQELFWIVKHGIKYAGMPAWPALQRDDEIWAVVAFLRVLPQLDEASYRRLAMGEVGIEPQGGREIATGQANADTVSACARCHGAERPPTSALVPTLHGQPAELLLAALKAYAAGDRPSGVMQPIAVGLSHGTMARLADYYAGLRPQPRAAPAMPDPARIERGRKLAEAGSTEAEIPACLSCHGQANLPLYPRLAGQPARYLEGQLRAWQAGLNDKTATGALMAPIARRLTAEQIADLSAYFSSLPAIAEAAP